MYDTLTLLSPAAAAATFSTYNESFHLLSETYFPESLNPSLSERIVPRTSSSTGMSAALFLMFSTSAADIFSIGASSFLPFTADRNASSEQSGPMNDLIVNLSYSEYASSASDGTSADDPNIIPRLIISAIAFMAPLFALNTSSSISATPPSVGNSPLPVDGDIVYLPVLPPRAAHTSSTMFSLPVPSGPMKTISLPDTDDRRAADTASSLSLYIFLKDSAAELILPVISHTRWLAINQHYIKEFGKVTAGVNNMLRMDQLIE
jgi:hypothetical protein